MPTKAPSGGNAPTSNPYFVAGTLPWGASGAGLLSYAGSSGPAGALAAHYGAAYNEALAMNQANYANILQGYQQSALAQMGSHKAIRRGYDKLLSDVMGRIENVGVAERGDIADSYENQVGRATQQLIGAGLGNSTVTSAVERGLLQDRTKENTRLAEAVARMKAGYQSELGQQGLAFRERATQQRLGATQAQLNWMNSIQAQYPDAGMYSQIAAGLLQAQEAEKIRASMQGPQGVGAFGSASGHGGGMGGGSFGGRNVHPVFDGLGSGGGDLGGWASGYTGGTPSSYGGGGAGPSSTGYAYSPFTFGGSGAEPIYGGGGYSTHGGYTGAMAYGGDPGFSFGGGGTGYGGGGSGMGGGFGGGGGLGASYYLGGFGF